MRSKGLVNPREYFDATTQELILFFFLKCYPGFPQDINAPFKLYRDVPKETIKKKFLKNKK